MPDISEMKGGKYLKKEDFPQPRKLTISGCDQVTFRDRAEGTTEKKWVLHFDETEKSLILNTTNIELIARATNERNSDNWGGKHVTLYNEENVSMGGKLVGGIRVRKPLNNETREIPF